MKLKAILVALALTGLVSTGAKAGPNPYSDCGIGAAIFKNDIAASISNVIWDLGITAIISATASPDTCDGADVETAMLILETLPELEKEFAVQGGETTTELMASVSCQAPAGLVVAASYEDVLLSADYAKMSDIDKATHIYEAVQAVSETDLCRSAL